MARWIVFLVGYLIGSFFGFGQVMAMFKGLTAKPTAA